MKYEGRVYARINNRYIECTQSIEDLEERIEDLEQGLLKAIAILHNLGFEGNISYLTRLVE